MVDHFRREFRKIAERVTKIRTLIDYLLLYVIALLLFIFSAPRSLKRHWIAGNICLVYVTRDCVSYSYLVVRDSFYPTYVAVHDGR